MQLIIPFCNEGFSCIEAILAWSNTLWDSTNENLKHSCIQKQLHRMQYKGLEHKDLFFFFMQHSWSKTCTMSEKDQTII